MPVVFPPNVDQVTLSSQVVHMVFPVSNTVTGASYTVLAGFQLTPEELGTIAATPLPSLEEHSRIQSRNTPLTRLCSLGVGFGTGVRSGRQPPC